jgi:hypothetical protein
MTVRASSFWVESKRSAQIGRLCSAPAGNEKRHAPGQIALEPERASVETILALIATAVDQVNSKPEQRTRGSPEGVMAGLVPAIRVFNKIK